MENLQTRREFLKTSGKVLAGVALASSAFPLLNVAAAVAGTGIAPHPFTYVKLDPQATIERGYKSYYSFGGCGMGAFDALAGQLAEAVGYPYTQFPAELLSNASGGYGVGSLCGSLGGAALAVAMACAPADAKKITGELMAWYREHPFPAYQPEFKNPTSVSGPVNCLDSSGKFMEAAGVNMASDERKARCAAVTGEVAGKAAELLNAIYNL